MRTLRTLVAATLAIGAVLVLPAAASADGGAFISFDRTHYLAGETANGQGYIFVPTKHQDLLEQGPFYGYLVNAGPDGSDLNVGAVVFERYAEEEFELSLSFVVPDVAGDYYTVRVCNEPCTIAGFQEPLTGTISIVETEREATLLTQNTRLEYRMYSLGRKLRKAERMIGELEATLASQPLEENAETVPAETDPATAPIDPSPVAFVEPAESSDATARPLVEAWALLGLGGTAIVAISCIVLAVILGRGASRRSAAG
jgi:hypothetical protein